MGEGILFRALQFFLTRKLIPTSILELYNEDEDIGAFCE